MFIKVLSLKSFPKFSKNSVAEYFANLKKKIPAKFPRILAPEIPSLRDSPALTEKKKCELFRCN
jgi:hypothetical protein